MRVDARVAAAVAAGGALGGTARYGVGLWLPTGSGGFPWATLLVNVAGSLVLGAVVAVVAARPHPSRVVLAFAGTGVCGGFTTWSTFMTDAVLLGRAGRAAVAVAYLGVTLAAGLAAMVAGLAAGRQARARAAGAWS